MSNMSNMSNLDTVDNGLTILSTNTDSHISSHAKQSSTLNSLLPALSHFSGGTFKPFNNSFPPLDGVAIENRLFTLQIPMVSTLNDLTHFPLKWFSKLENASIPANSYFSSRWPQFTPSGYLSLIRITDKLPLNTFISTDILIRDMENIFRKHSVHSSFFSKSLPAHSSNAFTSKVGPSSVFSHGSIASSSKTPGFSTKVQQEAESRHDFFLEWLNHLMTRSNKIFYYGDQIQEFTLNNEKYILFHHPELRSSSLRASRVLLWYYHAQFFNTLEFSIIYIHIQKIEPLRTGFKFRVKPPQFGLISNQFDLKMPPKLCLDPLIPFSLLLLDCESEEGLDMLYTYLFYHIHQVNCGSRCFSPKGELIIILRNAAQLDSLIFNEHTVIDIVDKILNISPIILHENIDLTRCILNTRTSHRFKQYYIEPPLLLLTKPTVHYATHTHSALYYLESSFLSREKDDVKDDYEVENDTKINLNPIRNFSFSPEQAQESLSHIAETLNTFIIEFIFSSCLPPPSLSALLEKEITEHNIMSNNAPIATSNPSTNSIPLSIHFLEEKSQPRYSNPKRKKKHPPSSYHFFLTSQRIPPPRLSQLRSTLDPMYDRYTHLLKRNQWHNFQRQNITALAMCIPTIVNPTWFSLQDFDKSALSAPSTPYCFDITDHSIENGEHNALHALIVYYKTYHQYQFHLEYFVKLSKHRVSTASPLDSITSNQSIYTDETVQSPHLSTKEDHFQSFFQKFQPIPFQLENSTHPSPRIIDSSLNASTNHVLKYPNSAASQPLETILTSSTSTSFTEIFPEQNLVNSLDPELQYNIPFLSQYPLTHNNLNDVFTLSQSDQQCVQNVVIKYKNNFPQQYSFSYLGDDPSYQNIPYQSNISYFASHPHHNPNNIDPDRKNDKDADNITMVKIISPDLNHISTTHRYDPVDQSPLPDSNACLCMMSALPMNQLIAIESHIDQPNSIQPLINHGEIPQTITQTTTQTTPTTHTTQIAQTTLSYHIQMRNAIQFVEHTADDFIFRSMSLFPDTFPMLCLLSSFQFPSPILLKKHIGSLIKSNFQSIAQLSIHIPLCCITMLPHGFDFTTCKIPIFEEISDNETEQSAKENDDQNITPMFGWSFQFPDFADINTSSSTNSQNDQNESPVHNNPEKVTYYHNLLKQKTTHIGEYFSYPQPKLTLSPILTDYTIKRRVVYHIVVAGIQGYFDALPRINELGLAHFFTQAARGDHY